MRRLVCLFAALAAAPCAPAAALDRVPPSSQAPLQPCPEYGAGFGKVPGTSTCLRVSGRVSAGADIGSAVRAPATAPVAGRLAIDTRSETDYGTARTFMRLGSGRPLPR